MQPRVLVVDESPSRAGRVTERLKGLGCSVSTAPTAGGALECLAHDGTDLLIVNWYLEDMLLHDFAEHAKHVSAHCTIMVSFDQADAFRPRGMDDPYVDGSLPYECSDTALRDALGRAVGGGAGARFA
jgi:DNA-binding response OmpR family regulator